ncbi:MAG: GTP-binding protein [Oscillospiraceae bacterium]|nr:GTP-binding protein [Oscillospiraceae bacterium]
MIPIDLITGFLGAGKTTFLLRYARYLLAQGLRLGILVYDHGAVNVDMPLLQALRDEGCELEMLSGACDPGCHRRRFRTKLIAMAMSGYDRVLIEPSGLFDMDEFFDVLHEEPLDRWYEAGSVIAVVDAMLEEELSPDADFFLASQAASAGCVLLSRCQWASPADLDRTLSHLRRAQAAIHCPPLPEDRVLAKDWKALTEDDFKRLMNCGYRLSDYVKSIAGVGADFQSLSYLDLPLGRIALEEKVRLLFANPSFGRIHRVKGFFPEGERWYQLNATGKDFHVSPVPESRAALVVIGSGLREEAISLLLTGSKPEHQSLFSMGGTAE